MFAGSTIIVAAALLLCCAGSALANPPVQPNMNHLCLLLPNGMGVASGIDCTSYYSCYEGQASLQSCTNNLQFDKDMQQCMPASQTICTSGGVDALQPCVGRQNGTWVPATGTCGGFYYCGLNGEAIRGNCPLGENFSYQSQKCVFNSAAPCTETTNPNGGTADSGDDSAEVVAAVNLCDYVENGVYFASAAACNGWNLCTNDMLTTGTCPTGYVFNAQRQNCDYPSDTNCNQVSNDPELSGATAYGGPCTSSGLLKSATTCAHYYQCDGTSYILMKCTNGLYFDTVSQTCVNRLQARNNCDRCAGSNLQFVSAYSKTACTEYLYCQNNAEKSTGTCPSGAFFSELAGACVTGSQPLNACCNPAVYTVVPPPTGTNGGAVAPPPAGAGGAAGGAPAGGAPAGGAPAGGAAAGAPAGGAAAGGAAAGGAAAGAPAGGAAAGAPAGGAAAGGAAAGGT